MRSCSSVAAQIGGDHGGVVADLGGCALGDLLAVVQHDDLVGQAHDHVHLVLDQAHGDTALDDLADQLGQALGLLGVDAAAELAAAVAELPALVA